MILVVSSSLNPDSRSRLLAAAAYARLQSLQHPVELLDLRAVPLPACDGAEAYGDENAARAKALVESADAILLASPIYNFHVNSAAKNLVELTGRAWTGKVVGFLFAAGGHGSYMSGMGFANSLMLDFRCLIVPRFVYATGDSFAEDALANEEIETRVRELVDETVRISSALAKSS